MYDERKFKRKIMAMVEERRLYPVMNNTKWRELQEAVKILPFLPAYQIKDVHSDRPSPVTFDEDHYDIGNWDDEVLMPFFQIEWICVRPRLLIKQTGTFKTPPKLIKEVLIDGNPELLDETQAFLAILQEYSIPYEIDEKGGILIFGYKES